MAYGYGETFSLFLREAIQRAVLRENFEGVDPVNLRQNSTRANELNKT